MSIILKTLLYLTHSDMLQNYELNFQRLMFRSRKLCRDNLNGNLSRLQKAVDRLQLIFIQMQADQ